MENQKFNLDGLSVKVCAAECNETGCIISGKPYCAHPRKGGLHFGEQQDPDALKRHRAAIAHLDRAAALEKANRAEEDLIK